MSTFQKEKYDLWTSSTYKNAELKPWDLVHVDLISSYNKYRRQHQTGGPIIKNNVSLTCTKMIYLATGWFEMMKILTYDLDEFTGGNAE